MRKIFHLTLKPSTHRYYCTLTRLCKFNKLGVSKAKLDRWDWSKEFENDICVIRKGELDIGERRSLQVTK
jgi:hypothetical protein